MCYNANRNRNRTWSEFETPPNARVPLRASCIHTHRDEHTTPLAVSWSQGGVGVGREGGDK